MADLTEIISGDDVSIPVTLYKDGVTFTIDPGATVKAGIVNTRHTKILLAAVTLDEAADGADWANSLVMFILTAAQSATLNSNDEAFIEIEVDDGGKETFFVRVKLVKGLI